MQDRISFDGRGKESALKLHAAMLKLQREKEKLAKKVREQANELSQLYLKQGDTGSISNEENERKRKFTEMQSRLNKSLRKVR